MHLPYIIIVILRPSNHKCCVYVSMLTERDCTGHVILASQMSNVAFEILLRILQVPFSNLVPDASKCWDSTSNRPRPVPFTFCRITSVVTTLLQYAKHRVPQIQEAKQPITKNYSFTLTKHQSWMDLTMMERASDR
jgi:hypothetical protein